MEKPTKKKLADSVLVVSQNIWKLETKLTKAKAKRQRLLHEFNKLKKR